MHFKNKKRLLSKVNTVSIIAVINLVLTTKKNMNETKFKVLTYLGQFVDENMLIKGIYTTSVPNLKSKNATIKGMIQQGETIKDMNGNLFVSQSYFDNLKQCELLDFTLIVQAK